MKRGQEYYRAGDYSHASVEFRNALQIDPKSESALLWQSEAAEKMGRMRDAAHGYQALLDQHPGNITARARLGRIYVLGGDAELAQKTVAPGLEQHPQDTPLLVVRGLAKLQSNDLAGAAVDADAALKGDPTDADAVGLRAGIYQRMGNSAAATQLLRDSLNKIPDSDDLHTVLLSQLLADGDRVGAEAQIRTLIKLKPGSLQLREQLAHLLLEEGRKDEAQGVLEQAAAKIPGDDVKLTLVSFVAHQRSQQQGEQLLRQFIDKEPANVALRFGLAQLLVGGGKPAEALQVYEKIAASGEEKAPNTLAARNAMARIYLAQGRDDQARALVAKVLASNPQDTDALLVRGELALAAHQSAAAIADLRAVLRSHPSSVPVQELLSRAYLANGEVGLAEQSLRAALDVAPDSVPVRIELAQFLDNLHRSDEAIRLFEQAVSADPQNAACRRGLAIAYLAKHDFQAALKQAEQLKLLRPNEAAGAYLAGVAYRGLKRPEDAQHQLEAAHDLEPDAIEPLSALAQLHVSAGHIQQAISLVRTAADRQKGKNARTANLLGELYLSDHDRAAATEAFQEAARIAPDWYVPRRNLALTQLSAGDSQGAIENLKAALLRSPAEPVPAADLARIYEKQRRIDDAIAVYEDLKKHNPASETADNNLAMLLVTYRDDPASLDRARDLTDHFSDSRDGGLLDTSGWVHFKRAEYPRALELLERAVTLSPESAEIRYHLAMAQLKSGQGERARSNLESALSRADASGWSADARAALASLRRGG